MTKPATSVLELCTAIACCAAGPPLRSLERFASATGFGQLFHYESETGLTDAASRNLFFLVHAGLGDRAKSDLITGIRQHKSTRVRFAPVVLIAGDLDGPAFLDFVQMGFDDVLCLPDKPRLLADRLAAQLNRDIVYIETEDYLGPDRRRMDVPGVSHPERVSTVHLHTRILIRRSIEAGPVVLHRQDHLEKTLR